MSRRCISWRLLLSGFDFDVVIIFELVIIVLLFVVVVVVEFMILFILNFCEFIIDDRELLSFSSWCVLWKFFGKWLIRYSFGLVNMFDIENVLSLNDLKLMFVFMKCLIFLIFFNFVILLLEFWFIFVVVLFLFLFVKMLSVSLFFMYFI